MPLTAAAESSLSHSISSSSSALAAVVTPNCEGDEEVLWLKSLVGKLVDSDSEVDVVVCGCSVRRESTRKVSRYHSMEQKEQMHLFATPPVNS